MSKTLHSEPRHRHTKRRKPYISVLRFAKRFFLYSAFGTATLGAVEFVTLHREMTPMLARSIENLFGSAGVAIAEEILAALEKEV